MSPPLVMRDPYILDFLGLRGTWQEDDLEAVIICSTTGSCVGWWRPLLGTLAAAPRSRSPLTRARFKFPHIVLKASVFRVPASLLRDQTASRTLAQVCAFGCHPDAPMVETIRFTEYFNREVLRKRPYLRKDWCVLVLQSPLRSEPQDGDRWRFWGAIPELEGRHLRVVTLADKVTVHNAFPDRRFNP